MPVTSLDLIAVQGHYLLLDGSPAAGVVMFRPSVVLVNTTADEIILPSLYSVTLDIAGKFSIMLPATDDPDLSPVGWTYAVTESITGAVVQRAPFNMIVPFNTPVHAVTGVRTLDMADVSPAVPVDAVTSYVLLSTYNADQAAIAATYLRFLQAAMNPDLLIVGAITRDANGAATSAPVVWPDGTAGTYTATTVSTAFPGAVDAYSITYGSPVTKTYTQPAVTRNADGATVTRPAMAVA